MAAKGAYRGLATASGPILICEDCHMHSPVAPDAKERFVPVTLALGLGTFLVLFDVTAVVVITPVIVRDLGFAIAGAAWIIDAYSLASSQNGQSH